MHTKEGGIAELTCPSNEFGDLIWNWDIITDGNILPLDPSERFNVTGNRLTITNVSQSDEGQYLASIVKRGFVIKQCAINLTVISGKILAVSGIYHLYSHHQVHSKHNG